MLPDQAPSLTVLDQSVILLKARKGDPRSATAANGANRLVDPQITRMGFGCEHQRSSLRTLCARLHEESPFGNVDRLVVPADDIGRVDRDVVYIARGGWELGPLR